MNTDMIPLDRDAVARFDYTINAQIVGTAGDEALRALWSLKVRTKRRLIGQTPAAVDAIARAACADLQRMVSHAA